MIFAFLSAFIFAQSPEAFKYQAAVRTAQGDILANKSVSFMISILEGSTSGTVVYKETHNPSTNDYGIVNLNIGKGSVQTGPFSAIDWASDSYFVRIELDENGGSDYKTMGESQLLSVPYALYAKESGSGGGGTDQTLSINEHDLTISGSSGNTVPLPDDLQTISKTGNTVSLTQGGGSFTDDVNDADADASNEFQTLSISGNDLTITPNGNTVTLSSGITLPYTGTYTGSSSDLFSLEANNTSNVHSTLNLLNRGTGGCLQIENETGGNSIEIEHYGNATAISISNHGLGYAIYAEGAVKIENDNNQTALSVDNDGTGYCAYFNNGNSSNTKDAIYAKTNGTGNAGTFIGNVSVTGSISKGSGTFKIDHPLDPKNKYLYHSFVESPDMMNVYNGNVDLDQNGEAWIVLPEWFDVLNKDFRYQLTCIGGFAQVFIAEEISENKFKIGGGNEGLKVSWQITGIRHDPYAEQNRIQVEVEKEDHEKGYYLHNAEYGMPFEMSIQYTQKKDKETVESGIE